MTVNKEERGVTHVNMGKEEQEESLKKNIYIWHHFIRYHTVWESSISRTCEVNMAGSREGMGATTFVVLVQNKIYKQGRGFVSKWSTWSGGACRSLSYQLGRPRGCCPSAGQSNSDLGGVALGWTLADSPGLSCGTTLGHPCNGHRP